MKKIAKVKFGLLTEPGREWIEITSPKLWDENYRPADDGVIDLRMGALFGHKCKTCGMDHCTGHFGYVTLPIRDGDGILNPLFGTLMPFLTILPNPSREIAVLDGNIMFDDITLTYVTVLNIIDKYSSVCVEDMSDEHWNSFKTALQFYVNLIFENKGNKVKKKDGKPYQGIIDYMKGKQGLLRRQCLGKRSRSMARSVFSLDPGLSIDEIGIPMEFKDCLDTEEAYHPDKQSDPRFLYVIDKETERRFNIKHFRPKKEDWSDYRMIRPIQDGDLIMMNRAPSLHKYSILAFYCKLMPGKTIRINPMCCAPFNADADGDAVNVIVPQSDEAKWECEHLMLPSLNIVSLRHNKRIICPAQDFKAAQWLVNQPDMDTKEELDAFSTKVSQILRENPITASKEGLRLMTMRAKSRGDPEQFKQIFERGLEREITKMPENITYYNGPRESFREGLSPGHFWQHCSEGRMSIVARSISPSKTGYMQRKLIFAAGDLRWDGEKVVDAYGRTISYEDFSDLPVGTYVGILMAQWFGELSTQTVLRAFHRPGEVAVDAFSELERLVLRPNDITKEELVEQMIDFFEDTHIALAHRWIRLLADLKFAGGEENSISWAYVRKYKPPLHSLGFERIRQNLMEIVGKEDNLQSPFSQVIVGSYQVPEHIKILKKQEQKVPAIIPIPEAISDALYTP